MKIVSEQKNVVEFLPGALVDWLAIFRGHLAEVAKAQKVTVEEAKPAFHWYIVTTDPANLHVYENLPVTICYVDKIVEADDRREEARTEKLKIDQNILKSMPANMTHFVDARGYNAAHVLQLRTEIMNTLRRGY